MCEERKPPEEFYANRRICKTCNTKRARGWAANNPERHAENARGWQKRNPDKVLNMKLKRQYGITLDDYRAMAQAQGHVCAICGQPSPEGKRLAVDHCHKTNRVRALLCHSCNVAIGLLAEDPTRIRQAADYLDRHEGLQS